MALLNTFCRFDSRFDILPWILLLSLSPFFTLASSSLVNITVDDQLGDPTTGLFPEYSPNDGTWHIGSRSEDCQVCFVNSSVLDLTQIYDQTWHDTTSIPTDSPPTITVHFNGSAVYVFNILANTLPQTNTFVNISFSVDGEHVGAFTRTPEPDTASILYNQLVYHKTTLNDGPHTLTMTAGNDSLILFDYLIHTAQDDDETPTSSSLNSPQSSSSSKSMSSSIPSPPSEILPQSSSSSTPKSSSTRASDAPPQFSTPIIPVSAGPQPSDIPPQSSPSRAPEPIGVIVGAVLGAIALFVVAIWAFTLYRRRAHSGATGMDIYEVKRDEDGGGGRTSKSKIGCQVDGDHWYVPPSLSPPSRSASPASLLEPISPSRATISHTLLPSDISELETFPPLVVAVASPESSRASAVPRWSSAQNSKRRAELDRRLEALRRTRSVLSSHPHSESNRLRLDASNEGGMEATTRELEAEIAQLRGVLAAMNARFMDDPDSDELLPAYAE